MLALSKKTGYGLIAMTHLATLADGEVCSARDLAGRYGMPLSLLMNVLKELASGGFVQSVRGPHGGYRLVREPETITLGQLIGVLDRPIELAECLRAHGRGVDINCKVKGRCPIVDPINRVQQRLIDFLGGVKLSELVRPAVALPAEEGAAACL